MSLVSICIDGIITTHIPDLCTNTGTACGQSIDDDPEICGHIVTTEHEVDCTTCICIWKTCRSIRKTEIKGGQ